MRIELDNFYPYGTQNGDTTVPTNDDGSSGRVNIMFPFPFFDEEHESLFVSTLIYSYKNSFVHNYANNYVLFSF
jgi:hypothetical protein